MTPHFTCHIRVDRPCIYKQGLKTIENDKMKIKTGVARDLFETVHGFQVKIPGLPFYKIYINMK